MKLRLIESLGSIEYKVPLDTKTQIADFYVIQHLLMISSNNPRYDEELRYDLYHAYNELNHYLKGYLLKAGFYAIMLEGSNCFNFIEIKSKGNILANEGISRRIIIDKMQKAGIPNKCIKLLSSNEKDKNYILNQCYDSSFDTVSGLRELFLYEGWSKGYGGKAWATCCEIWSMLYKSQGINDINVAIDQMYSAEHNTGAFLSKDPEFDDDVSLLLDTKFDANNVNELKPFASNYVKQLVDYFGGKSLLVGYSD